MDTLTIRPVTPEDIATLHQTCWPQQLPDRIKVRLTHFIHRYEQGHGWGIVAEKEGQPVAFGQILRYGSVYEICDLVVMEAWRGQGIGTALIQRLIQLAAGNGVQRIEIGAALSNPRALALYQRLGFKKYKVITLDVGNGPESIQYLTLSIQEIKLI